MIPEFIEPSFVNESDPDTIHERMLEELPADLDNMPGGFVWDFTRPTALEVSQLIQFYLINTLRLMFPMWAWDEWLDYHAEFAGINRRAAGYASGRLTVSGIAGTQIPSGTIFATAATGSSPSIEFVTTGPYVIDETGTIEVLITAIEAGTDSNVAANTVTLMSKPISGITSIYNENPITGGTEEEDDETLRERIQELHEYQSTSFVGNDSDYKRWAQEVAGVGSVVVIPEWDGPGTVKLVILDLNGQPANEQIISEVYNHIISPDDRLERKAPIGAILTVTAPEVLGIRYAGKIVLSTGYELENVIDNFKSDLWKHYESAKEEGVLKYTKVCSVLSDTNGVSDFSEFTMNGSTANIVLAQDEYPETISVDFEIE